jgi:hypothetical protein
MPDPDSWIAALKDLAHGPNDYGCHIDREEALGRSTGGKTD